MGFHRHWSKVAFLIAALAAAPVSLAGGKIGAPDDRYDALLAVARASADLSPPEQVHNVEASYWMLFPRASLKGKGVEELDAELRGALVGANYTHLPAIADRSLEVLAALEDAHAATAQRYAVAFQALIAASELDAADALARQHPGIGLSPIPGRDTAASFVSTAPAEWVFSTDGGKLTRRGVSLDAPFQILVVAHPLCHFSQHAVAAISQDAGLAKAFAKYAHWITPSLRESDFSVIAAWNREHPGFEMASVYDPNQWHGFDFRETPLFFFLVNGKIQQVVTGWPGDEQASRLEQAIVQALDAATESAQSAARIRK